MAIENWGFGAPKNSQLILNWIEEYEFSMKDPIQCENNILKEWYKETSYEISADQKRFFECYQNNYNKLQ